MLTNEPIAVGNLVTMIFTVFGTLFARYGITQDDANQFVALVGTVVSAGFAVLSWWHQRKRVTPVANPKNDEGTTLVPLNSGTN